MIRFVRPTDPNPPLTNPAWGDDTITLRPVYSGSVDARAIRRVPDALGVSIQELRDMPEEERDELHEKYGYEIQLLTLEEMIESWTFRYPPTPEQESAGEPGDPVPVTLETLDQLGIEVIQYLQAECAKRKGSIALEAGLSRDEFSEPAGHADKRRVRG